VWNEIKPYVVTFFVALSRDISILVSSIGDFLTLFQYLHLCEESLERSVGLLGLEASVEEEGVLVGPP
jgi:hypothetical protein